MSFDSGQILAYAPMLILIGMGCVMLLAETFVQRHASAAASHGWASPAASRRWAPSSRSGATRSIPSTHFQGMLVVDRMSLFLDGAFIVAGLVTLLFSGPYLREQGFEFGEFYAMVLFGVAGMIDGVARRRTWCRCSIGIETMSLAAYVLTGCWRRSLRSSEGAMKYFLMGAFATGFLVYGMALVYGTTGGRAVVQRHRQQGRRREQGSRCSSSASTSSSSRSRSRSRRCPSTCGRPTPTRARPRR